MTDPRASEQNNDPGAGDDSRTTGAKTKRWKVVTGLAAVTLAATVGGLLVADTVHDVPQPKSMSEVATPDVEWEYSEAEEPPPVASFEILGDDLVIEGQAADVVERANAIWGRFVTLVPTEHRRMLVGFELMGVKYEGAHVYPTEADPTKWVLGIAEGLGSDLDMTLIHEWAHLVTLSATEVPPNPNAAGCKTFFTGEGCSLPTSIIARFVEAFWSPEDVDESDRIYGIYDVDDYYEAMDAFLAEREGEFVTEYAATNPGEDLAETFAVFILNDRPTGAEIKDLKVLFLWDDPNLVALRDQVRARL